MVKLPSTEGFRTMGSAYYIVLEREIDGLDTLMDGKSLSRHIEQLDQAAEDLGVRPLSEFFSMDPVEMTDFLDGEGMETDDLGLPRLEQFSPQEGLATVRALLAHPPVPDGQVVTDLKECERILAEAVKHHVGWHFQIDV